MKTLYAHQAPKPDPLSFLCITGIDTKTYFTERFKGDINQLCN